MPFLGLATLAGATERVNQSFPSVIATMEWLTPVQGTRSTPSLAPAPPESPKTTAAMMPHTAAMEKLQLVDAQRESDDHQLTSPHNPPILLSPVPAPPESPATFAKMKPLTEAMEKLKLVDTEQESVDHPNETVMPAYGETVMPASEETVMPASEDTALPDSEERASSESEETASLESEQTVSSKSEEKASPKSEETEFPDAPGYGYRERSGWVWNPDPNGPTMIPAVDIEETQNPGAVDGKQTSSMPIPEDANDYELGSPCNTPPHHRMDWTPAPPPFIPDENEDEMDSYLQHMYPDLYSRGEAYLKKLGKINGNVIPRTPEGDIDLIALSNIDFFQAEICSSVSDLEKLEPRWSLMDKHLMRAYHWDVEHFLAARFHDDAGAIFGGRLYFAILTSTSLDPPTYVASELDVEWSSYLDKMTKKRCNHLWKTYTGGLAEARGLPVSSAPISSDGAESKNSSDSVYENLAGLFEEPSKPSSAEPLLPTSLLRDEDTEEFLGLKAIEEMTEEPEEFLGLRVLEDMDEDVDELLGIKALEKLNDGTENTENTENDENIDTLQPHPQQIEDDTMPQESEPLPGLVQAVMEKEGRTAEEVFRELLAVRKWMNYLGATIPASGGAEVNAMAPPAGLKPGEVPLFQTASRFMEKLVYEEHLLKNVPGSHGFDITAHLKDPHPVCLIPAEEWDI
ncbi:hypothetical protein EJ06DRAFT_560525 [Trichodelitschia bisporula]|uniref:Uncharacterized protein n=1 Tax=Trichodelitschia bisporula TaxID=703511 RepID=A0A6G1HHV0_9PEZI|nr:hypothetical protein EJ06DRAFT_560525 [Trichodelitschia bisporula]